MAADPAVPPSLGTRRRRATALAIAAFLSAWLAAVVVGAETGALAALHLPLIAALVALGIAVPTLGYAASGTLRTFVQELGHRPLMLLHIWRIPAALLFFWYGARGALPPTFWILAGTGDLIAGSYALVLAFRPETARRYLSFHVFGFADFVVAVGTGLTFTLLLDPRMAPIAALPMALIPLFGVGLSGATHLMAFHMLWRGVGMRPRPVRLAAPMARG
jgi:hypothetical protein